MLPSCPISTRRIDSNMVRIISLQVAIFTLALLIAKESFFAFVLFFDFTLRVLHKPQFSPFHIIGLTVINLWGIAPKLCDESPKRFALYLGLVVSGLLVVLFMSGLHNIATLVSLILLLCALMETLFDFCIGCKLYYAIQLLKVSIKNDRNIN